MQRCASNQPAPRRTETLVDMASLSALADMADDRSWHDYWSDTGVEVCVTPHVLACLGPY